MSKLDNIKNIICIASGKGGVGKSTTAGNLALALVQSQNRVGLFDADIYGPSLPLMLGVQPGTRPEIKDQKFMLPIQAHGLVCNSMGFLVDEDTAMVWRGPMVTSAFNQILNDTLWSELDYLIVDMPPGTGDIQLNLAQSVNVAGAIIVTTPQDVALLDARKGIEMFRKVDIPIIGIVENMSIHVCSACGHEEAIFGSGGGEKLSTDYGVDVIGKLPLDISIRQRTDEGLPSVISEPSSPPAQAYLELGQNVEKRMGQIESESHAKPQITISDD